MPHLELRPLEYSEAVTAVVARRGFDGMTLADVAAEAGVSRQTMARCYPSKSALARAAFGHARDRANASIATAVDGHFGIEALRLFVLELLPLDDKRLAFARVLVPAWQMSLHDQELAALGNALTASWRLQMRTWLREAMADGEVRADVSVDGVTEMVLNFISGAQAGALADGSFNSAHQLRGQVDSLLHLLRG
ncbi:TetR/AcrR family transcriptional regulator [Zhihengliuella sp.]|uniref:TetR/AcrR family transcriptional regulator n=1 Tax=Zhihengliuella sp. TaxID=1954483 RepID=UPI0028126894|nr:TetR/AcrR family transcriptional regulator [Zhihengliuella sp.]